MDIHFKNEIAKEVGVNAAIVIENFVFWIRKNKANNKHLHDNEYWTYNSMEAFAKIFDFWSSKQIRTILEKLKKDGYIKTGNYNEKGYDRTSWYSFTKKGYILAEKYYFIDLKPSDIDLKPSDSHICPKGQMDLPKRANGFAQKGTPIPYTITDTITDNIYIDVITYLNDKAGTRYRATTSKTRSLINARVKDGFTLDDFKQVIDNKCTSWLNTDMQNFLRPETLFGNKFEGYLNEKRKDVPKKPKTTEKVEFSQEFLNQLNEF